MSFRDFWRFWTSNIGQYSLLCKYVQKCY
jgi:hypothetical protein